MLKICNPWNAFNTTFITSEKIVSESINMRNDFNLTFSEVSTKLSSLMNISINQDEYDSIMVKNIAASNAGKIIVKSPAVDVLSLPKSNTQTAALVSATLALSLVEGVVL